MAAASPMTFQRSRQGRTRERRSSFQATPTSTTRWPSRRARASTSRSKAQPSIVARENEILRDGGGEGLESALGVAHAWNEGALDEEVHEPAPEAPPERLVGWRGAREVAGADRDRGAPVEDRLQQPRDLGGRGGAVGVAHHDQRAARRHHADPNGVPLAAVGGGRDHPQRRAARRERPAERDRSVGRAVVDDEDLEAAASCLEERDQLCDRGAEAMFFVVGGDDDGEVDGGAGHRIAGAFRVGHAPTTNASAIPTASARVARTRAAGGVAPTDAKPCPRQAARASFPVVSGGSSPRGRWNLGTMRSKVRSVASPH